MHLFEVIATNGEILSVFGKNFDEAAALFTAWHGANHGAPLPDFEVRQRNPRWPGLNTQHLIEALARNVSGVGRHDPANGWVIHPPFNQQEG